jgi:ABC-2 type transport system ATP-binding protein
MASLKENTYLKVALETDNPLPSEFINEHMVNYTVIDGHISFLYNGNVNDLLGKLSQLKLNRVNLTEPDLEEIFMHYYVKE